MQHLRSSIAVFVLVCVSLPLLAQNAAAAGNGAAAPGNDAVRQITLGNATVPLDGLWKFRAGDNLAWAQPDFDDSGWGTMDLTPPPGSYDPILGSSGFVPGWTARGYKGYSGYAWYRLRVDIQDGQSALALKMPDNFDDAYQVYVNGQMIGEFGRFTAHGVTLYNALPRSFPLPADLHSGPATVAIRMWMAAFTPLVDPDVGGLHGPPVLGHASAIVGLLQLDWDAIDRANYSEFFEMAILLLALGVAFGLFWLDRTEPAYLWLGLTCAALLAFVATLAALGYTTWIDGSLVFLLQDAVLTPASIGLWVLFWAYWFRLDRMARVHRMVWSLVVLLGIGMAMLRAPLYGSVVPVHAIVWLSPLTLALKLLLGVLLVWVTVRGIRKDRAEGWLALPAVVLVILSLYEEELIVLHLPGQFFLSGVGIGLREIGTILSLLIITVLLLRRFLRTQREREQLKLEIEQARQVQQMLIPEALPQIPGLTIESEYRPARVVGGDFFQIIPHASDGSVLIVVGDVAGHGLQAGMLVALIVGAIRTATDTTFEPLAVLRTLNQRLLGRGQAHATCLAMRIAADGEVTLANAGHMPPYLSGKEFPMEGALPLGMVLSAEFPVMHFQLQPGDTLMLLSDGVAEAQDAQGHLFGFERIEAMLREPMTAAEVATAAQEFGQQDDISVMRVVRAASSEIAAA
ncbi:MAG TPA: SpoIIE family protein phosphatase [Acidobacteriaceae bacterium]|nr:SpoIIE family protein phosphatase [Acidobacteriaceae bacterium]